MTDIKAQSSRSYDLRKLHIDFACPLSIGHAMAKTEDIPDDRIELIRQLVLEAGRLMEDHSPECARTLPEDVHRRTERLDNLLAASEEISAIAKAAHLLNHRLTFAD